MDYSEVYGLTREVREKLTMVRPLSLGQASRISGVTPAALMAIQIHLKKPTGKNGPMTLNAKAIRSPTDNPKPTTKIIDPRTVMMIYGILFINSWTGVY